jgi:hypothetical protein
VILFALLLPLFPVAGFGTWRHLFLPAIALGAPIAANVARLARTGMLETLGADFVRAARAKGLPERIVRHPELFLLGPRTPEMARADVERRHAERTAERVFEYTRSDGSTWRIGIADALARKAAFETAYDPNDCVEVRWGAPEGTKERATCHRRAPAEQRALMEQYREWFRESWRPTR